MSSSLSGATSPSKHSAAWIFTFPSTSRHSSVTIDDPVGYKPLTDKALSEEVAKASAQARAISGALEGHHLSADARRSARELISAVHEKAWRLSWSPIKTLGMNLVMLYFGGVDAGIFTVLILAYSFLNALKTLLSVNLVFQSLEQSIEKKPESANNNVHKANNNNSTSQFLASIGNFTAGDYNHSDTKKCSGFTKFLFSPFLFQKIVFVIICAIINGYILYHAASIGILSIPFIGLIIPENKSLDHSVEI